jgi:hypothetical protein
LDQVAGWSYLKIGSVWWKEVGACRKSERAIIFLLIVFLSFCSFPVQTPFSFLDVGLLLSFASMYPFDVIEVAVLGTSLGKFSSHICPSHALVDLS